MTSNAAWLAYEERFDAVLNYIYDHLEEPLDLIRLADVAGFSPRHWHRVFASTFGETLPSMIKRIRLQRATSMLTSGALPIREVASACGYPNLSSFTRAFRQSTGITPAQYRDHGTHIDFRVAHVRRDPGAFDVQIRALPSITCVAVRHRGSYMEIDRAFHDLRVWLATKDHDLTHHDMYGVFLSDPTRTPEPELESLACVALPPSLRGEVEPLSPDAAIPEQVIVAGGLYASLTHVGAYADMPDTYAWLFGCWVPHTGRVLADEPVVERYVSNPRKGGPTATVTEILLPLA